MARGIDTSLSPARQIGRVAHEVRAHEALQAAFLANQRDESGEWSQDAHNYTMSNGRLSDPAHEVVQRRMKKKYGV